MLNKISKVMVVAVFSVVLAGCANSDFSHKYLMRGQVITASSDNIVVCVGLDDGAQVGQQLIAYRFYETVSSGEGDDIYEKRNVGKVKIEKIIDEHYAKVSVIEGNIKKHDMVQLNK
ncbi:MAG: hypothetical protein ACPG5R_01835 [Cognaticolwellia aestuarii]